MKDLLGNNMRGHSSKNYNIFYSNNGVQVDGGYIVLSTEFMPSWYINAKNSSLLHADLVAHFKDESALLEAQAQAVFQVMSHYMQTQM